MIVTSAEKADRMVERRWLSLAYETEVATGREIRRCLPLDGPVRNGGFIISLLMPPLRT
jgi:hypothetical protein